MESLQNIRQRKRRRRRKTTTEELQIYKHFSTTWGLGHCPVQWPHTVSAFVTACMSSCAMPISCLWAFLSVENSDDTTQFKFSVASCPQRPSGHLGMGSPGWPPRLSRSSWALATRFQQCILWASWRSFWEPFQKAGLHLHHVTS